MITKAVLWTVIGVQALAISAGSYLAMSLYSERNYLRSAYFTAIGLAGEARLAMQDANSLAVQYAQMVRELRREKLKTQIEQYVSSVNPRAPAWLIADAVIEASEASGIEVSWLLANIKQESYFDRFAVSSTGCRGLAQLCRMTAKEMGVKWEQAFDVRLNIMAGALYLKKQYVASGGNMAQALHRYNGGDDPLFIKRVSDHRARILKQVM